MPCPFCGQTPRMIHNSKIGYWASCRINCIVVTGHWSTEAEAVAWWNTRQPAAIPVEVQPPEHVREYVTMVMEGECGMDELRFVVYNDAERGEWLRPGKCYCGCDACKYCEQLLEATP